MPTNLHLQVEDQFFKLELRSKKHGGDDPCLRVVATNANRARVMATT
jgi:hypothetical protein